MNRRSFLKAFSFLSLAPAVAAEIIATHDPQKKLDLWRSASTSEFNDINAYFANSRDAFMKPIYDHIFRTSPFMSLLQGGTFPHNAGS
jgi:hypothetical protein